MTDPCKSRDRSTLPFPQLTTIPDDLGEYIARYVRLVMEMGLEDCVKKIVEDGEIFGPGGLDHLSCRLLKQYWNRKGGGWFCQDRGGQRYRGEHPWTGSHTNPLWHTSLFCRRSFFNGQQVAVGSFSILGG